MRVRVTKWGNDLAVRLPAEMVEASTLQESDEIEIEVADTVQSSSPHNRDELLNHLRSFRGRLPADFKFDRDEANIR